MNQERVIVQKSNKPRICVEIMIPNTGITGLLRFLQIIDGGVDNDIKFSFSVGPELVSFIHAALTHVLNPWNIMATLIKMADGKKNPIFRNLCGPVMI